MQAEDSRGEAVAFGAHIQQRKSEDSLCLGCMSCELLCALVHEGESGIDRSCIRVQRGTAVENRHSVLSCMQCADAPCYEACPKKDVAMCRDEKGIVYINDEECIGCGKCARACRFTPSRIAVVGKGKARKARKCDLCRTREDGPVCIAECPARCLLLEPAGTVDA